MPEPQFEDLYREVILDHYRRPRNRGPLEHPTARASGANPVCGDEVEIQAVVGEDRRISDLSFQGVGCSISQASASLMTERLKGETIAEAERVRESFRKMLLESAPPSEELGDLDALEGVRRFPVRVKCALLAWNVLHDALVSANTATQEDRHA